MNILTRERGFTMMELVTFVTLTAIGLGSTMAFFQMATEIYSDAAAQSIVMQQLHHANNLLSRDIRAIRDKNSILTASSSQLSFTNSLGQSIIYSFGSGQLSRNGTTIAIGLTSFSFSYSTWNGTVWISGSTSLIACVNPTITATANSRLISVSNAIVLRNAR